MCFAPGITPIATSSSSLTSTMLIGLLEVILSANSLIVISSILITLLFLICYNINQFLRYGNHFTYCFAFNCLFYFINFLSKLFHFFFILIFVFFCFFFFFFFYFIFYFLFI